MNNKSTFLNAISCLFGAAFLVIGFINLGWGNDALFGVFVMMLALAFFPPVTELVKKFTGFAVPGFVKILLGVFILWASVGVGELFAKIDLMRATF